jgi:phosphoserine phosphatase RsbU/P
MMDGTLKILLVEDSETDADLLVRFLKKENIDFSCLRVWNRETFISALKENDHDLIIADHTLPQFSGIEAFRIAKTANRNIPFILITGSVSEQILIEYAKEGVDDYILKENLLRLPSAIEHIVNRKKIEQLHKKLESAYKDIKDSINYAKRIQNAMLPDIALLSNSFPESFILFKPKDILSGDFYWFKKEKNEFFISVCDCTGHGIPGALMSMIGIEILNNIILNTKDPSEILEQLNERIEIALCQSAINDHSPDGMDIALCCLDIENRTLKFAGANRPLWIIQQGKSEVEEIKGSINGIGGLNIEIRPEFETSNITFQKGDSFYIFSDGFTDQFGGEYKIKLTRQRFKQLLLSIQDQTMPLQKESLDVFIEEWKAGTEQLDDMLIIGVRVE